MLKPTIRKPVQLRKIAQVARDVSDAGFSRPSEALRRTGQKHGVGVSRDQGLGMILGSEWQTFSLSQMVVDRQTTPDITLLQVLESWHAAVEFFFFFFFCDCSLFLRRTCYFKCITCLRQPDPLRDAFRR